MAYPDSLDSFTTKVDNVDSILASHVNSLQNSVVAIETELGVLPKGGYADVATRLDTVETAVAITGWRDATGTWSYSSADAPTFVVSVNADMTTTIYVGQKLSLTQTTEKFFIVTAVGAYSGGNTLITMYGGTDYTLANAAITTPKWSNVKSPSRFPMSPSKWTVTVTDTTERSQVTSGTTVYNLGSISISAPIGIWEPYLGVKIQIGIATAAAGPKYMTVSLSTANNSINADMSAGTAGADIKFSRLSVFARFPILSLAAKTTYYFTARDDGGGGFTVYALNSEQTLIISFVCAYL